MCILKNNVPKLSSYSLKIDAVSVIAAVGLGSYTVYSIIINYLTTGLLWS